MPRHQVIQRLFIHFCRLNILSYSVLEGWYRLSQCSGEEEGQFLHVSSLGSLHSLLEEPITEHPRGPGALSSPEAEFRAAGTDCASVTHRVGEGVHPLQAPSEMFCLQDLTELQGAGTVWYGYDTHSFLFSCSCCRLWRKISLTTLPPSARMASLIFISSFFASKAFALFKFWTVWSFSYESHTNQLHIWVTY